MKVDGILCIFLVALLSGGCSPSQPLTRESQVSPHANPEEVVPTQLSLPIIPLLSPAVDSIMPTPTILPTQGEHLQMIPSEPGLQGLIEKAKEDLAERLTITIVEINVAETEGVIWPDSSLGCGKPGTEYLQVITPGFRISLEAEGQIYSYHTNTTSQVILCSERAPLSISPTP